MKTACRTVILALGVAFMLMPVASGQAQMKTDIEPPSIVVQGKGEVRVKADMAQIRAGVTTQATTAAVALMENSKIMTQVLSGLTDFGIPETDIKTSNFSVSPRYSRPAPRSQESPGIIGYQVTNQVQVKIRDLDRLGAILDRVVQLGANQIHGVQFSVTSPQPLLDQARVEAVKEARRKAELLCQAAGVKLGRVLSIRETGAPIPRPMLPRQAEAAMSVPIARGQESLTVSVTLRFAIQ